jgi:hypothetical protein
MKNAVFWDVRTQFVPHRKHYVSSTKFSRLMLCKIWGFHGGDYEECRLLGYKNPVRTSQETHYVSATEPNRLMLRKIWSFHGGDYEYYSLLGCGAVWAFPPWRWWATGSSETSILPGPHMTPHLQKTASLWCFVPYRCCQLRMNKVTALPSAKGTHSLISK